MSKQSRHPLYGVWRAMINRCHNPKSTRYSFYGARGIRVCSSWMSFENFLRDMGPKPFPKATIERKDGTADYCPGNCRWASPKEQARNTRSNHRMTFLGKTQCLAAWAEELGIPEARIFARKKLGWSDEKALSTPRNERVLEFNGQRKPMRVWAKESGIGYRTIWFRLSKGWSVKDSITIPVGKYKQRKDR